MGDSMLSLRVCLIKRGFLPELNEELDDEMAGEKRVSGLELLEEKIFLYHVRLLIPLVIFSHGFAFHVF